MSESIITKILLYRDDESEEWRLCKIQLLDNKLIIHHIPSGKQIIIPIKYIKNIKILDYHKASALLIEYENEKEDDDLIIEISREYLFKIKDFIKLNI